MNLNNTAAYLTLEFLTAHSPQLLSRLTTPEIKLWLCPFTALPVFSSVHFKGPKDYASNSIPKIGQSSIHIRVPHELAICDDEASKANILRLVYSQIIDQLSCLNLSDGGQNNLQSTIQAKQKQVDLLGLIINQTEKQHAPQIIH